MKCFRHGEICFEKVKVIPKLDKSVTKELLKGSHGNSHLFDGGEFYPEKRDDFIFGYFKAKNTILLHIDHGIGKGELKKTKLPDGNYRLRRQVEWINEQLRQVED